MQNSHSIKLYEKKSDCTGCMACQKICPVGAIDASADIYGFVFPQINAGLCIGCKKCERVCPLKKESMLLPVINAYAATYLSQSAVHSSSGGIFYAIAKKFVDAGGIVFGCAWDDNMVAFHVGISIVDSLRILQGSKYVQSDQRDSYVIAKEYLQNNTKVLYSGTPCQIAGLKSFLERDYENLYTIDLFCHGVPSAKMHAAFVDFLEQRYGDNIVNMNYREKSNGWSLRLKCDFQNPKGRLYSKRFEYSDVWYYYLFEKGLIFRDACYECPFSKRDRVGDISLGDYWGIEQFHPNFRVKEGVSAVLVNSKKGIDLFSLVENENVNKIETNVKNIIMGNHSLMHPVIIDHDKRSRIFEDWIHNSVAGVLEYQNLTFLRYLRNRIVMHIPFHIKNSIKRLVFAIYSLVKRER